MKIGDRCFVHGYVDEIRKDTVIIRNRGGYFGTDLGEVIVVNNTAHPNWISVSERLPEEDGLYLVTTSKGQVQMHVFSHNGNSEEYWLRCNKAWRELPEPYREEGEG